MKKFTSMIAALLFAVASFAAAPAAKKTVEKLPVETAKAQVFKGKADVKSPRTIDTSASSRLRGPRRAAEDFTIISEQPEGELKIYTRAGGYLNRETSGDITNADQSGYANVIFAADNKVYIRNIVSECSIGTWVEGTLSEDGKTITVALGQNLYYVAQYDACIALALIKYDETDGYTVDTEAKEVTFSVEDDVISLQGTASGSVSLGVNWTDDASIQYYGDFESVFTPLVVNTPLVELPEGAEVTALPLVGKYYESVTYYSYDISDEVSGNVNVAHVGDDFYFQGLMPSLPNVWVKGTLNEDGDIDIPVTFLGIGDNGSVYAPLYAMGYSSSGVVGFSLVYDAELNSYELDGYLMLSSTDAQNDMSGGIYIPLHIGALPDLVELPEGLEAVEMPFTGSYYDGDENALEGTVNVAIDEESGEVYIQGLSQEMPEAWIKGEFNEDGTQVIFPSGQFLGLGDYGSIYLVGGNVDEQGDIEIADIVFDYDADHNVFTLANEIFDNGKPAQIYFYGELYDVVIGTMSDGMWVAAEQGYENQQEVFAITISEEISGTIDKGDGTTTPKYYTLGEALRIYAGNIFTITSQKAMAKIVITMTGTEKQMTLEANVGEYVLEGNVGTWTGEAKEVVFTVPNVAGTQARIVKIDIYYFDYSKTLVEAPEDLQTAAYLFKGTDLYYEEEDKHEVLVGFYGNEVYIQGLSLALPDAWVKGTLQEDGTLEIPGWYLGLFESLFGSSDIIFGGATFHYDAEKDEFTCDGYETLAGESAWDEYSDVVITRIIEIAATPADPLISAFNGTSTYPNVRFSIPLEDIDGNAMLSDKLSYVFFVEKDGVVSELVLTPDLYQNLEDNMTEIPYNFSDDWDIYNYVLYLNQDLAELKSWSKIGIQVIYRGGGEENKSNIFWFDLTDYWPEDPTALNSVSADVIETVNYDVLGRRVSDNTTGIIIQKVRMSDGSTRTIKVLHRNN